MLQSNLKVPFAINDSDKVYIQVPCTDFEKLMRAWRERLDGKISVTDMLEVFERWNSVKVS